LVDILIKEKLIQEKKLAIVKNSKEKKEFVNVLINRIGNIDTIIIHSWEILEEIVNKFASIVEEFWYLHAKQINITKGSKTW